VAALAGGVFDAEGNVIEQSPLTMRWPRPLRAVSLALLIVVLAGGAIPALAAAPGPGQVGGPPSRPLEPPVEGVRTSADRVIGVGQTYDGRLEIDAYGWRPPSPAPRERRQICIWAELEVLSAPMYGSCFAPSQVGRPIAIEANISVTSPRSLRDTEIGGSLTSDIARVELSVRRPGHKKAERVQATVAQVSGRLQQQLRQSMPFGYFYAKMPGNVPARDITAIAYDASGQMLGKTPRMH